MVKARAFTPTPIAIIGIPTGLELRHDQLKTWVQEERISSYETRPGKLFLYWRALQNNEFRVLPLDLIGKIPGSYGSISSRVYPYYNEEQVTWAKGTSVMIHQR